MLVKGAVITTVYIMMITLAMVMGKMIRYKDKDSDGGDDTATAINISSDKGDVHDGRDRVLLHVTLSSVYVSRHAFVHCINARMTMISKSITRRMMRMMLAMITTTTYHTV